MKDKKTFGSFIKEKRIENGYSQKDLAQMLYVTESAVSKWERGVTYPDITMISDLCKVLGVTEHELIESSHDTEYREMKDDAIKYNRIKKTLFWILNISYFIAILTCFIVNLAIDYKLSWFFIVLTSIVCGYTFCPTITWVYSKFKKVIFIASTILSLFLLFLTCSIYTSNYWFMIATLGVILGYFMIFYPILFNSQKKYLSNEKYEVLSKKFLLTYVGGMYVLITSLLVSINAYTPMDLGLGMLILTGCMIIPLVFGLFNIFNISRKTQKIVGLSLTSLLVAFIAFSAGMSIYGYSTLNTKTTVIEENFTSINIDVKIYYVVIKSSDNNECKVINTETNKVLVDVQVNDGTLEIKTIDNREFYERMMFSSLGFEIEVYLPSATYESLYVENSTGDLKVSSGFTFSDSTINISTGDVSLSDVSLGNVKIIISTGDIYMKNINCTTLDINAGTGDKKLINVISTGDMNIKGSTGDIILDGVDAANIYITNSTGDVKGTILTDKLFDIHSNTGEKAYPESRPGGMCQVKTSTGDILLSYK